MEELDKKLKVFYDLFIESLGYSKCEGFYIVTSFDNNYLMKISKSLNVDITSNNLLDGFIYKTKIEKNIIIISGKNKLFFNKDTTLIDIIGIIGSLLNYDTIEPKFKCVEDDHYIYLI